MSGIYHNGTFDRIPDEKKQRILSVALEEFASRGFSGANTNDIARKAGISIGSLYKYFRTKEDFFLTVVSSGIRQLESILKGIMESGGALEDQIESLLRTILEHSRSNGDIIRIYNEMTTEGNAELIRRLSSELEAASARCFRDVIQNAADEGVIPGDIDVGVFAFALDNLFMSLQFSYASDYYRERMKIFLGDDVFDRDEQIISEMLKFIKRAFTLGA